MRYDCKKLFQLVTRSIVAAILISACLVLGEESGFAQSVKNPDGSVTVKNVDGSETVTQPDGSSITTGIPDETHRSNGTREDRKNEEGRVVRSLWTDEKGNVVADVKTKQTDDGIEVIATVYSRDPEGKVTGSSETISRTNRLFQRVYFETKELDETGKQVGGTKEDVDDDGNPIQLKWWPRLGIYGFPSSGRNLGISRSESSAAKGFGVANEVTGGLNTTTFTTPRGKVRVNLPDDMAAGDTLSGTVIAEPQGKNDKERTANQGELSGYVVELEKQQASSTSRILKSAIPTASSTTYLILRDKDRKEVAKIEVPLAQQTPPVERFDLPTLGQQGRVIEVTGRFDGDTSTTNVKVGGEDLEVLAESPRKVVARNSDKKLGPTELAVAERGQIVKGEFHSVGIKLSAPKLNLLRGEQTTLTVTVHGLEGIREDVPLVLENKSVDVITMGEQNVERIIISPGQVQAGSYTINRQLTGIQPGAFTITGTVTGRNGGSNQPLSSTSMIGEAQKAAGTPGYTICGSGCNPPATEQGPGRIRCITTSACKGRGTGCACHMFRRPINTNNDYEHVENPDVYVDREAGYDYVCRCVKK